jgi:hypothetical protein
MPVGASVFMKKNIVQKGLKRYEKSIVRSGLSVGRVHLHQRGDGR